MPEHTCEVVVVHCIDFRLQPYLNGWLVDHFGERNYDRVAVAGAVKNLDFVMGQLEISHRLHQVKVVVLINHEDCGAYGAQGTKEHHHHDLVDAEEKIKARFPTLRVEAFYLHLSGMFERIRVDQ